MTAFVAHPKIKCGFVNSMAAFMKCRRCEASDLDKFTSECAIRFSEREGLNQPTLLLCHDLTICLHCGFAEFMVPQRELKVLAEGKPVRGAVTLPAHKTGI